MSADERKPPGAAINQAKATDAQALAARRHGLDPLRRVRGLAGDPVLRHGAPERAARLRHRSRRVPGLRLGHGHRPHRDAEIRHRRSAPTVRQRRALAVPLRLQAAGSPDPGGRIEHVMLKLSRAQTLSVPLAETALSLPLPRRRGREWIERARGFCLLNTNAISAEQVGLPPPPAGEGWGEGVSAMGLAMVDPKHPDWKVSSK